MGRNLQGLGMVAFIKFGSEFTVTKSLYDN